MNPSTADENQDDPTMRRCRSFATAHGYGGFVMLNLFAYRSTDPDKLPEHLGDPERENVDVIKRCTAGQTVIAAWGAHPRAVRRAAEIVPQLKCTWMCLGITKDGHPRHPLYLASSSRLRPWSCQ